MVFEPKIGQKLTQNETILIFFQKKMKKTSFDFFSNQKTQKTRKNIKNEKISKKLKSTTLTTFEHGF